MSDLKKVYEKAKALSPSGKKTRTLEVPDTSNNKFLNPQDPYPKGGGSPYDKIMEKAYKATPNSRAQYNLEKAAGGAMTDLSYEEWKKL
jgi:hypothetical protein